MLDFLCACDLLEFTLILYFILIPYGTIQWINSQLSAHPGRRPAEHRFIEAPMRVESSLLVCCLGWSLGPSGGPPLCDHAIAVGCPCGPWLGADSGSCRTDAQRVDHRLRLVVLVLGAVLMVIVAGSVGDHRSIIYCSCGRC